MKAIRLIIAVVMLVVCSSGKKDDVNSFDPKRLYTVQELQEDFRLLREDIEKRQPNLYAYTTESRMDSVFDSMYVAIKAPMTWYQFYAHVCALHAFIKDGHNFIGPGEATSAYADQYQKYFPLHITCINGRMYSDMNCSRDTSIWDGAELLSLNDEPAQDLQKDFMSRMLRDGNNMQLPLWLMNTYFRGFYGLMHGFPEAYRIVFRTRDGSTRSVVMPALPLDTIISIRKEKYPARFRAMESRKLMRLDFMADSSTGNGGSPVALISISSFDPDVLKLNDQKFGKLLEQYFEKIDSARCTKLVLDLRDNNGGSVVNARKLAQHIMTQRFEFALQTWRTRRINPGNCFNRLCKCRVPGFGKGKFNPVNHPFAGSVIVLINGGSFSATSELCSVLKRYARVTFVGEETGGNRYLGGGQMFDNKVRLPNTGIICQTGTEATVLGDLQQNDGHGIYPDHEVHNSIEDIVSGNDAVLQYALHLSK